MHRTRHHRSPLHAMMTPFIAVPLGIGCVASLISPQAAEATFSAVASGSSSAGAQSIPVSAAPNAVAVGREVTVSWPATTLSGGTVAVGYTVRRYDTSGNIQTIAADCLNVAATNCTEHSVPFGAWRYSIVSQQGSWSGAEGAQGATITVSTASFTLGSTAPITALPAAVTGTVSQFEVGETLTYRLDSTTGPVLSGSPSTVTDSTSMSVSVTIPAGTTDAPHSVFVVGSTGSFASAAINIVIPPQLVSVQMRDLNSNGKIDQVTATFDDALEPYSAGLVPWTLANVPSGGSLSTVTVSGATATLTITEGAGAANTAVGSFTIGLTANSAGIRDVNNHPSSFAPTAPTDLAPPAPLALTMNDTNANAKVDQVTMTFSEPLATYTAPTSVWVLAGVPSGGSRGTVTVVSPNVTIAITEGGGAVDTSVGSFTVTLSANATGIRDAAGNQASFTLAPADGAKPIRRTGEMFDDNADGKIDRVLVVFSETLAAYTAPNTVWSLASAPSGATLNTVTVTGSSATLALNQGAGAATTAVGAFTVALTADAAGIRDTAGNLAGYTATAPTDRAAPALITLSLLDNNGNGKVDRATAVFSEALSAYSAGTTPWTLTNVPSGGTLASVAIAGTTATLTITEGAGAADTTVGTMTIAMTTSATGIRDALGNLASFTARTPLDSARPAPVTIADTNGTLDGRIQAGDTLIVTFSEPIAPATIPASTTISITDPAGTGNDTLTMTAISNGAGSLGTNSYVTADNTVATFLNSPVALSNANKTVTVTVGPTCSGTGCASIATNGTAATYSYVAATTITDVAGNVAATAAKTNSMRAF